MKHYIIIRYNVGLFSSNPYGVEDPDKWMGERLFYFRQTIAALISQINQNFETIILIDKFTPMPHLCDIISLCGRIGFKRYKIEKSINTLLPTDEWHIQTRLDNDDLLAPTFTLDVQKQAQKLGEKEQLIDFEGIQVDIVNGYQYTDGRALPNSPFCSIVTKDKFIFDYEHTYLPDHFENQVKLSKIGYYQILHDHNLKNKPKGGIL